MATLILTAVGTAVGGPIGGAIGAIVGQSVAGMLFAPAPRQGPRLGELAVQTSSYGTAIPKIFGTMRVAGTVIWATDLVETRTTSGGGKGRPGTVEYSYSANFAVALSARGVREVRRIWADGKLLRGTGGDFKSKTGFRLHLGDEDQAPDPLIVAAEGAAQAPAFRGVAYAVFEELALAEFGNRIPSLSFELVAEAEPVAIGAIAAELGDPIEAGAGGPALRGYAASGASVRGAVEELAQLADLSLVDTGAALVLGAAEGAATALPSARESKRRELVRGAAGSVPREVTLTYHDAGRDYQSGLQRAALGAPAPDALVERRSLAAVLSAAEARDFAERRLDRLWTGRVNAALRCGWACAGVRPGARVALADESGIWRVRRWTLGAGEVKLELVRVADAAAPAGPAASPGRAVREPDLVHGPTMLRLYDLPLAELSSAGRPAVAVLAAGSEAGWRRAALSVSFDAGASWQDVGATAAPAVIGTAATVLGGGGSALFDRAGSFEVELLHEEMALAARDEDALVAGANLALIGAELVQFGAAERVGPRRWRLGLLLRGRRGTEWAAAGHAAGEPFALIEAESLRAIELPAGLAAGTQVRVLASGVADAEPAEAALVAAGEALRPPGPVHLRAEEGADGSVRLSWVRRSRAGWAWTSGADTPLGEENERYQLTLSGTGWARTAELADSQYIYDAAARAADGPGPVVATVAQLGTHGASRGAPIIIS